METNFDGQVKDLREKVNRMLRVFSEQSHNAEKFKITMPEEFEKEFLSLVDKVNFGLMEHNDNFYGYFLFQMSREIRFDISSPTAVNFKGAKYIIYFNPLIFLELNMKQMESTIKHEILHIVSMHFMRAKELQGSHSALAINIAMDIVVNKYLDYLPPHATTLEGVNLEYTLDLEHHASFEYYVKEIQTAIDKKDIKDKKVDTQENEKDYEDEFANNEYMKTQYDAGKTHDIWDESSHIDEKTLLEFTEKVIHDSQKGKVPSYLQSMIAALQNRKGELPWNLYLNRLMGTVESNKKKTSTRRNRNQPTRLDLKGYLRSHKAKIVVAIDISGSISDEEFKQAMIEVLNIVKNYSHEITIIECDDKIRRGYKVKSKRDLKDRIKVRGGTKFNPVFEYANQNKINLLVYFTDGKGEDRLKIIPRGYKILWVISGRGDELSLKEPYGAVKKLSNIELENNSLDTSNVEKGGYSMNNQESI